MANRTGLYGLDIIAQDSTVKASIDESGNIQADGTLQVDGASTMTGNVAVTGNLAVTGTTAHTGAVSGIKRVVEHHTTGDTLGPSESGSVHTNKGAAGEVTIVLPSASAANLGVEYFFFVLADTQELRIDPNTTQTIALPSTGAQSGAGAYITANAVGEWVHIKCLDTGAWHVLGFGGTWTAV